MDRPVEFVGAVKDLGQQLVNLSQGKRFELTDRMAYILGIATVSAVINGAMTAGFTGQMPNQPMDFLAFRTGRKDKYGNDVRFLSPTYLKDIYAYTRNGGAGFLHSIISSANPLLNLAIETSKGRDYYGVETRHEGDRIDQQALQEAQHIFSAFMPFWLRGEKKAGQTYGAAEAEKIMPLGGFMPTIHKGHDRISPDLAPHA